MFTLSKLINYLDWLWVALGSKPNEELLVTAFTHKSFSADAPDEDIPHNERLEFLGDAILWSIVASSLYKLFPDAAESQLTLSKIYLVKEETLAHIARKIDLGEQLRLGKWEDRSGWRDKDAVLSDGLEAVIWYIYLDCWRQTVESFIERYIMSQLDELQTQPGKSWKSKLQEYVQKLHKEVPEYIDHEDEVEESGNVLLFRTEVSILGELIAEWTWSSKKKAQEEAAEKAYKKLIEH